MPKISIFVITWNRLGFTKHCLDALFYTTKDLTNKEIIVIDNGSNDGTVEYLRGLRKEGKIKTYFFKENMGCGVATNKGMELSKGQYIVEVDNDIILLCGWWEKAIELMEREPAIGQLGLLPNPFKISKIINNEIDIAPPNVAGAWIIPRKIYDMGVRWCERSWKEEPWQAKLFSDEIIRKMLVVGNIAGDVYAKDLSEGNHHLYPEYYKKTFTDRGIENLLNIKQ
jgi:glycosyltransferase involved in cell wall biosynthesis